MMNIFTLKKLTLCTFALFIFINLSQLRATTPLGMFAPYDINIKLKKPATGNLQFNLLGEKSYKVQGYATDSREDVTILVNPLQIYEPAQNLVSMYQGFDNNGAVIQTISTPFTELLDSIAGGPGGRVISFQNGVFFPTADLSCGQISPSLIYGLGQGFYIGAYLPLCFAKLENITWTYLGANALFAEEKIQTELINSFSQDACTYFNLNVGNWTQRGLGDLTILAEWQRDFPQRRLVLRNVQANIRVGISLPTAAAANENIIFPVPFGADGAVGFPFGGGLSLTLGGIGEVGFSGQFWYFCSNEKPRRIKTFPTQTSLLFPVVTPTYKEFAILQNFNLYGQIYSVSKRFSAKGVYQHWRRQKDTLLPADPIYNFDVANSTQSIEELTRHQFSVFGIYSPVRGDFKRIIPQFEIFWKGAFGGTRAAIASTYGAQFSLIF